MAIFVYGVVCYALFLVTFAYAFGFVENLLVPKSIDSGTPGPVSQAVPINVLLMSLFAVQHSVMARPWFKRWWTRYVPRAAERSTFVLATCIVLGLLFWQWRPITTVVWEITSAPLRVLLWGLSFAGWGLVLYASFLIDHFDLFGLRQVILHLRGKPYEHPRFKTPWLYRLVRNPLMLGFLIAFWAAPTMTYGHLLFSAVVTGYIFVGVSLEERDLSKHLGRQYQEYRARTPMILPMPKRSPSPEAVARAE